MENNQITNIESIENQLLCFNITDKDQPENINENFIQHKIDSKNLSQIKWSKLQSLLQEIILKYSSCHYELRIYNVINRSDENVSEILTKIKKISETIECTCDVINTKQGIFGIFFEFLFKQNKISDPNNSINTKKITSEVKIGTFGEESSGKSTTTSVLINGQLDDGNGLMRKKNFKFQHEFQSGKSLSISHLILGVDKNNKPIKSENLTEIMKNSVKYVNLYDMGGSEKAMKITLSLISPDYIDYALLFIDYKNGPTENTKKLYSLNNSVHIPIICVITMIDLVPNHDEKLLYEFIDKCIKNLSSMNPQLKPLYLKSNADVCDYISKLNNNGIENILPFICISNIKGNNIDLLEYLLTLLPNSLSRAIPLINNSFENNGFNLISSPLNQFDVHEHFSVDGKTILGGIVSKGYIKKNETYYFGPNKFGNFKLVTVETIHCKRQEVDNVYEGQYSSLSLTGKDYNPNEVVKGTCLIGINSSIVPRAVNKFQADVWWIGEEVMKEMKYKCEPVVIINHIRQSCKIINTSNNKKVPLNLNETDNTTPSELSRKSNASSFITSSFEMEDDKNQFVHNKKRRVKSNLKEETFFLSKNEKIELTFEFKNSPEYITEGLNIIINDSTFKAFGIITKVIYPNNLSSKDVLGNINIK